MTSWKCTICGFVDGGEAPPAHCPECGGRDAWFVPSNERPHGVPHHSREPERGAVIVGPGSGCLEED